jgi:hypothetical protein
MTAVKIQRKQLCVIVISIALAAISYFIPVAKTTNAGTVESPPKAQRLPEPGPQGRPETVNLALQAQVALPEEQPAAASPAPKTGRRTSEPVAAAPAKIEAPITPLTAGDFLSAPGSHSLQNLPVIPITQDEPFGFKTFTLY